MKKPTTLLRSFSSRLSTRLAPSPAVAPWPPVRSAYDRWLAAELEELRADPLTPCTSATWLARALSVAAAAQRRLIVASGAASEAGAGIDRRTIDECADDTAELLDACAGLRDRLSVLRGYVAAARTALRWLEGGHGGEAAAQRAAAAFAECEAMERRCGAVLAKCGSNLRRLGERAVLSGRQPAAGGHRSGGEEALSGARALALLAVGALGAALTFRPRRNVSGLAGHAGGGKAAAQWEFALQEVQKRVREEYDRRRKEGVPCMAELDAAAAAGRAVRCTIAGGQRCPERVAAAALRRCNELEDAVAELEEKVGELHRELIGVRIVLLEWAQRARGHELLRFDYTPWQWTPPHSEASCPRFSWSRKSDVN
ncbi:hypothetical protein PVAP13_8KG138400 [Panicum virgatum]|uniref:Uncharacterized protein n=1 Tax=Panicum virgatum TaxID=38727 RepID=A0A8T0PLM4_PANVG|nr:hypothetical protein PVAP13_8KG138400 [Panicum virgatum]